MPLSNRRALSLVALSLQVGCYGAHQRGELLPERSEPPREPFFSGNGRLVALSDDGRWLVYLAVLAGPRFDSHLLDLETGEDVLLDAPEWTDWTEVIDLSGDAATLLVLRSEVDERSNTVAEPYSVMDRITREETAISLDTTDTMGWYFSPHLSADGTRIAAFRCTEPASVRFGCDIEPTVFDWRSGETMAFGGDRALGSILSLAFSGDGNAVAYGSDDSSEAEVDRVFVCRTSPAASCNAIPLSRHVRLSDDGRVAAVGLSGGGLPMLTVEMSIWRDGARAETLPGVYPIDLSGDATTALVEGTDESVSRLVLADGDLQMLQGTCSTFWPDRGQWMSRDGRTAVAPGCGEEPTFSVFRW